MKKNIETTIHVYRVWVGYICPAIMQNQIEKNMETGMHIVLLGLAFRSPP